MTLGIAPALCVLLLFAAEDDPARQLRAGIDRFNAGCLAWDRAAFEEAAHLFEKTAKKHPDSYEAHYWLGAARFHVLLHRLGEKADRAELRGRIAEAMDPLERAVALNAEDSEAHALLGTLAGMQIAANPACALWVGRSVMDHRRLALKNDPDNPRAHYLVGTGYFHAPALLGGRDKGLGHFLKAEKLFEAEAKKGRAPLEPDWGYGSCLTFIGRCYQHIEKDDQAAAYYEKALEVNPQDQLAREGLDALSVKREDG